jgi:hypothetical protein
MHTWTHIDSGTMHRTCMVFALRSPSAERSEDKPLPLSQELSQAISQMNNLFSPMESHWACQLFLRTGSMPSGRCSTQNGINGILKVLGLLRVCQAIFTIQILCTGIVVAVFFFFCLHGISVWTCMFLHLCAAHVSSLVLSLICLFSSISICLFYFIVILYIPVCFLMIDRAWIWMRQRILKS